MLLDQGVIFVLILSRVSGLIMTAPGYGSGYSPPQIRVLLAIGISLLIAPLYWGESAPHAANLMELIVLVTSELLLGMAIGLAVLVLVSGLQLAGQLIGQVGGMQMADLYDSTFDGTVPVFSKLMELTALAVFFITGGHREVLSALLDSFHRMPPGSAQWTRTRVSMLVEVARQSFEVGLRASAPVVISVLLAVLILGLVSRTLPQLNILAVGFGLNGLVLLATFAVSIGAAVWIFEGGASGLIDAFRRVMEDPSATWDAVSPTGGP